jgi:carbonic anhydrase/acetyltransferase-like protein (isoleucine patch superfamily)
MTDLKYILRKTGFFSSHSELIAMRDIPEHGVKEGDLGGTVDKHVKLSQKGSCWIGKGAYVSGNVSITEDAYIGDNAKIISQDNARILIKGHARITQEAYVRTAVIFKADANRFTTICGNAEIFGNASLESVAEVSGSSKIFGSARLSSWVSITDNSEVSGNASIRDNVFVSGDSVITDNVYINSGSIIKDSHLSGSVSIERDKTISHGEAISKIAAPASSMELKNMTATSLSAEEVKDTPGKFASKWKESLFGKQESSEGELSLQAQDRLLTFNEIVESFASYETDITKIIQYPVMTDRKDPYTRAMVSAYNKAKRYLREPESKVFQDAVADLEEAFLTAESNARQLAATLLSDADKKRTEKAKDLFRVAANEASSEQEKKAAFVQGFKQLEGVLAVPEIAVDTFRVKIGLKEIEV